MWPQYTWENIAENEEKAIENSVAITTNWNNNNCTQGQNWVVHYHRQIYPKYILKSQL